MTTRKRRTLCILLFFCFLFLLSRTAFLDSDLPSWDVFNYQPIDELYYSTTAFNIYHYGEIAHKIVPYVETDSFLENLLGNILTSLTLLLFGNNYYGLRMSAVLASFFIFVTMYFTLKNYLLDEFSLLSPQSRQIPNSSPDFLFGLDFPNFVLFFALAYMLCDFSFLLAGRVMEPTIFRMLPLIGFLCFFSSNTAEKKIVSPISSLIIGFFAAIAVFYVYPTNFFLIPALFAICVWTGAKKGLKGVGINALLFFLGGAFAFLSYEASLRLLFEKSFLDIVKGVYPKFVGRLAVPVEWNGSLNILNTLKTMRGNASNILSTNFFRFNIILLAFFLFSLPLFLFRTFQIRRLKDLSLFFITFFLILQTLFINDYFYRKLIIVFPLVLLIVARFAVFSKKLFDGTKKKRFLKISLLTYWGFCVFVAYSTLVKNGNDRLIRHDSIKEDLPFLLFFFFLQIILLIFALRAKKNIILKPLRMILLFFLILPNLYFSIKYVYLKPTYTFKEAMIQMGHYIDEHIVLGMAHGFRLYNTSVPLLNPYKYQNTPEGLDFLKQSVRRLSGEGKARYFIAYSGNFRDFYGKTAEICSKKLNYSVRGVITKISLYEFKQ